MLRFAPSVHDYVGRNFYVYPCVFALILFGVIIFVVKQADVFLKQQMQRAVLILKVYMFVRTAYQ